MGATIHPTAEIEDGVVVGEGTTVWAHVHVRAGATVGEHCIVGEQTYLGPGVRVGNRVKLNAMVYVPMGVTIDDGVMVGPASVFTNDRYPRATDPRLGALRGSGWGPHVETTVVREGASIGAGCSIGPGLVIGRWAMVAMGSVVTRDVAAFSLVAGSPARAVGVVCRCGRPLLRFPPGEQLDDVTAACAACGSRYRASHGAVSELGTSGTAR
jgi:acetyltransferase-like isoleucine patch superfamily enzyme